MAGFIGPLKLHYLVALDCYNPCRELSVVSIESLSSVEYNTKFLHFIAGSYGGKNYRVHSNDLRCSSSDLHFTNFLSSLGKICYWLYLYVNGFPSI